MSLIDYFHKYNIPHTAETAEQFDIWLRFMTEENKKYNLTSITEPSEVYVKHYIDSIAPLVFFCFPQGSSVIDIGSGAGFPGIPIHLMRGDLRLTLNDSSKKKTGFIEKSLTLLDGGNPRADVVTARAEELAHVQNYREQYDFAVSRAVAGLGILCELCVPFLRDGGSFISYKSVKAAEEIRECTSLFRELNCVLEEVVSYCMGDNGFAGVVRGKTCEEIMSGGEGELRRVLIRIRKKKKISTIYPRSYDKILKAPIK